MDLKEKSYQNFQKIASEKGKTQYQIAKESGLSRATFTYWKQGQLMPKTETLLKIADVLDVKMEDLLA